MKIRSGFVSNSSSASFVLDLGRVKESIRDKVERLILSYPSSGDDGDCWYICGNHNGDPNLIHGWTIMDNGDLDDYMERHGISQECIISWEE